MDCPVVLEIPANVVRETFDKNSHKFIIVEDVAAFERTLGQLVRVLFDGDTILKEVAHGVSGVVDHFGRRVRTQEMVYGLRVRRDLLALSAPMASCVLRTS